MHEAHALLKKKSLALGAVARACDPRTQEAEAEGLLWVLDQPGLHSEDWASLNYRKRPRDHVLGRGEEVPLSWWNPPSESSGE